MKKHRATYYVAPLLMAALAVFAVIGCGTDEPGGTVLTIEEALAVDPGRSVKVQGAVVATETKVVLASALLESYPPQAGGAILPLEDLDLQSLVGLNSTADQPTQPGVALVTWSDYWVVLEGVIDDGVLTVQRTPKVVEGTAADTRVRFSPVSEPLATGETAWWAFDVRNTGTAPVDLVFASGQRVDVILSQDGVETYRWSDGMAFTEAIETVSLEPGQGAPFVLNDVLDVDPGEYELAALVTGSVVSPAGSGDSASGTPLPELRMTVTVW